MEYQLLSAAQRDAIVRSHLQGQLPLLGLTEISVRSWIDGSQAPVRRLFEIQLLKGCCMKACWGFSLDFVPHISAGHVRWHRSDKTAKLDIAIDPRDSKLASSLHGPAQLAEELRRLLSEAVPRARESWRKGTTFHGMLDMIREIRDGHTNCFEFDNYSQLPLAYVFLSAKTGDLSTAEEELDCYLAGRNLDDDEMAKLRKLVKDYVKSVVSP